MDDTMSAEDAVELICQQVGHGKIMKMVSESWLNKSAQEGKLGVGQLPGPHAVSTLSLIHI